MLKMPSVPAVSRGLKKKAVNLHDFFPNAIASHILLRPDIRHSLIPIFTSKEHGNAQYCLPVYTAFPYTI